MSNSKLQQYEGKKQPYEFKLEAVGNIYKQYVAEGRIDNTKKKNVEESITLIIEENEQSLELIERAMINNELSDFVHLIHGK